MKQIGLKVIALLLGSTLGAGAATTYTTGFEEPTFDPFGDVGGSDGWTIDNTVPGISFLNPFDADGAGGNPASQAGALGGSVDSPGPAGTQVNLMHPVIIPLTSFRFDVDFAVIGSGASFPGIDNFGWSFMGDSNAVTPLLRIAFEAPGGNGDLEIAWYDNLDTRHVLAPSMDVFYGSTNHLSVAFSQSGGDAAFTATISSLNAVGFSGVLAGEAATTVTDIGVNFDVAAAGGNGNNFIILDNLAAIPEANSILLLLVGLLGFARRHR